MAEEFIDDIIAEETVTKPVESEESVESVKPAETKPAETNELAAVDEQAKPAETPPEVSIEDLATQIGWNPNYKGEDAIDAATYILKSREIQDTMKDHNVGLKDQLTSLQGSIEALKEHNERVYQADVKRMQAEIDALKAQKKKAVELADVEEVDKIDQKIDDLREDLSKPVTKKSEPSTNPVYDKWVQNNQWYLTDPEMANYAETVAEQFKGAPLERVYSLVRQKVAEVFPDRFETPAETPKNNSTPAPVKEKAVGPASPVEGVTNAKSGQTFTKADLSPEQLSVMRQFVDRGIMTEERYIADVAKLQEG